jgi:hypothetical protein
MNQPKARSIMNLMFTPNSRLGARPVTDLKGTNSSEAAGASHSFLHFVSNPSFPAQSLEV